MPVFVFLHVLTMFIAVAMAYGPAMLMALASRRDDVVGLRAISSVNAQLSKFVGPAFGLGIALGVAAIFVHGFDPLAGWLLIAYALVGGSLVMTLVFINPWLRRVKAAADASPDVTMSAELRDLVSSPRNLSLLALDALIIVAREISFIGDLVGTYTDLQDLMTLTAQGKVQLRTSTYPLDAINDAIADLDEGRLHGRGILLPAGAG